jgi:hypothetical protein
MGLGLKTMKIADNQSSPTFSGLRSLPENISTEKINTVVLEQKVIDRLSFSVVDRASVQETKVGVLQ